MESCVSKRQMREHVFFVAFLMISFPLHISSSSLPSIPHSTLRNPDLWIVGAGNLGELIAKEWRTQFPDDIIISETITTNRHETLRKLGTIPLLRNQRDSLPRNCAKNVVISIPPSHQGDNSQYLSEIEEAIKLFDHSKNGMCLLISTTAVYPSDDGVVNEFSEVDRNPQNERAAR